MASNAKHFTEKILVILINNSIAWFCSGRWTCANWITLYKGSRLTIVTSQIHWNWLKSLSSLNLSLAQHNNISASRLSWKFNDNKIWTQRNPSFQAHSFPTGAKCDTLTLVEDLNFHFYVPTYLCTYVPTYLCTYVVHSANKQKSKPKSQSTFFNDKDISYISEF